MTERIIAIADVHGCYEELDRLLCMLSPTKDDTIVMLGDVVNRGPDSHLAVRSCREVGAILLMGNHERRFLRARSGKRWRRLNAVDADAFKSLDDDDWGYIDGARKFYYVTKENTVFVHGGFLPGKPWQTQDPDVMTQIQVVDPQGCAKKRSDAPVGCPHWSDLWQGPPFVVYGHTPWREIHRTQWTLGLDTGCVYGGSLSALILPDKTILQIRAAKAYYPSPVSWEYMLKS
jgi:serine/threonine protein phosphatase 1